MAKPAKHEGLCDINMFKKKDDRSHTANIFMTEKEFPIHKR